MLLKPQAVYETSVGFVHDYGFPVKDGYHREVCIYGHDGSYRVSVVVTPNGVQLSIMWKNKEKGFEFYDGSYYSFSKE